MKLSFLHVVWVLAFAPVILGLLGSFIGNELLFYSHWYSLITIPAAALVTVAHLAFRWFKKDSETRKEITSYSIGKIILFLFLLYLAGLFIFGVVHHFFFTQY